MEIKEFSMEMRVIMEVFYDPESMFGIYAMVPVEYNRELSLNKFHNVSLQGTTRRLSDNESYEIRFSGTHSHSKYGDYYKILEVEPERLDSVLAHDRFLKAILTDKQFKSLKEAYPNDMLVDLILEDKINTKLTKGIKKKSLATIKENVQKNSHISVLIARLNELGLTTNAINRLLEHFESSEKCVAAIDENIYNLCSIKNFGFRSIDKVALARGDNPTNKPRIKACIEFLIDSDLNEGHTWSPLEELAKKATEELSVNQNLVWDAIREFKSNSEFYIDDTRIAKAYARDMEISVYNHLKRIRDSYITPNVDNIDSRIRKIEEQQGFRFTDEQRKIINSGVKDGVMILNGKAGSGKSSLVKGLIDSIGVSNYISCALSGTAVKILAKRGIEAATIHRMLGYKNGKFLYNAKKPMDYDTIVIDEVSMINIPLLHSILSATKNGCRVIIVGDSGQLSAIGWGNGLRDLLETEAFSSYELTKVHRQAEASGILFLANSVRDGNQIMPYNSSEREAYGELQDQTVIAYTNKDSIPYDILAIAEGYKERIKKPEDLVDFQVIVPNRERGDLSVRSMNIELQQIFNNVHKHGLNRNGYIYLEGDKILAQGNSYEQMAFGSEQQFIDYLKLVDMIGEEESAESIKEEVDVYNGTMGHIKKIVGRYALIQFDGIAPLVAFEQDDLDNIDMGYAVTVHRLQGGSARHIVMGLDFGAYKLLSRQLVYTGLTRASEKGVLLAESRALHSAIANDENQKRRTFLRDIIRVDMSSC